MSEASEPVLLPESAGQSRVEGEDPRDPGPSRRGRRSAGRRTGRGRKGPASFWRSWILAFAGFAILAVAWDVATPLNGAPDERAHVEKAASVVRGQFLGPSPGPGALPAMTVVHVPAVFTNLSPGDCVIFKPAVPAGVCPGPSPSSHTVEGTTYVGHYPPLYYLLVGTPSYLDSHRSVYLMRLLSALENAGMLALAYATARRWGRSPLLPAAVVVAATPQTLFLSGVINPSGLEITAATAMWTAATVVVTNLPEYPPGALVGVLAGATSVTMLTRGLSPLWPAVAAVVLTPLAWRRLDLRGLARRAAVRWSVAVTAIAAVLAVLWIVLAKGLAVVAQGVPRPGTPIDQIMRAVAGQYDRVLREAIGVFGWLDTPAPTPVFLIWISLGGGFLLLGLTSPSRRHLASLAAAVVATIGIPFVLGVATARHSGLIAQGRYYLPLAVSIPLIAASLPTAAVTRPAMRRLLFVVGGLVGFGQFAAGAWALHRYLVGVNGPFSPFASVPGVWHPPLPAWFLDLAFLVGAVVVWRVTTSSLSRRSPAATSG